MKKGLKLFCLCLAAVGVAGACVGSVYAGEAISARSSSSTGVCGLPDRTKWIVGMPKSYSGHSDLSLVCQGYSVAYAKGLNVEFSFPSPYCVSVPGASSSVVFFDLVAASLADTGRGFGLPCFDDVASGANYSSQISVTLGFPGVCGENSNGVLQCVGAYHCSPRLLDSGPGVYLASFGEQIDSSGCEGGLSHSDYPLCAGEVSK